MRTFLAVTLVLLGLTGLAPVAAEAAVCKYQPRPIRTVDLDYVAWFSQGTEWGPARESSAGAAVEIMGVDDGIYDGADRSGGQAYTFTAASDFNGGLLRRNSVRISSRGRGLANKSSVFARGNDRLVVPFDQGHYDPNSVIGSSPPIDTVPEPGSLILFGFGLATGAAALRKRRSMKS